MTFKTLMLGLTSSCALASLAGAAWADPPSLVGRVSVVEGDVSLLPPGEGSWTGAIRNYPVTDGESFWTADAGRTELQFGPVEARLDSQTELDVLALDYGRTRLALPQGSIDLRLWRAPRGGVSIATPAGDVRLYTAGVYRVDVGGAGDGGYPPVEVTVIEGAADVPGPYGFQTIQAGGAALLYAGYDPQYQDAYDASIDDWARDLESRYRWDQQAAFGPSLTGFEDLEGQGDYVNTPDYGTVWYPRNVPADWAPYRYGHWAYVQPWGWTWIDDQPWGFAPFHYGRWAQIDGRWAWAPGAATAEPVYAPALVAFVGGGGWSIGFGGGSGAAMGWAPLAPDEVYRPSYQVRPTYLRQVNVTNVRATTINNITVNTTLNFTQYRNAPAATVVPAATFAGGGAVQRATTAVPIAVLARAPAVSPATAPPPSPAARAGGFGAGAGRPVGAAPVAAAPPPARLQAIRSAVAAQAPGSSKPPVIVGARIAPPAPRPAGAPAFVVAPAQARASAAQGRPPAPLAPFRRPQAASPQATPPKVAAPANAPAYVPPERSVRTPQTPPPSPPPQRAPPMQPALAPAFARQAPPQAEPVRPPPPPQRAPAPESQRPPQAPSPPAAAQRQPPVRPAPEIKPAVAAAKDKPPARAEDDTRKHEGREPGPDQNR